METKHITTAATLKTAGSDAGSIDAAFVRFNNRDRDGDVILPSAFEDGQEVIMTWAHDWTKPIGKGRVRVERDRAVFSGRLWLDTHDGEQAYRRIKNAGSLQQYSWGFQILDSDRGDFKGERVRFIKATELFEVSPVLIGAAGPGNTATLSVKDARGPLAHLSAEDRKAIDEAHRRVYGFGINPTREDINRVVVEALVTQARSLGVKV